MRQDYYDSVAKDDLTAIARGEKVSYWDGHPQPKIRMSVVSRARQLLAYLPSNLGMPDCVNPDVDGYIELQWYEQDKYTFSLFIHSDYVLYVCYHHITKGKFSGRWYFPKCKMSVEDMRRASHRVSRAG